MACWVKPGAPSLRFVQGWVILLPHFMKAIVCTRYGPPDVLQFAQVEQRIPKATEVLLKLYAASVNPLDLFTMRGAPLILLLPGLHPPKDNTRGVDAAGPVEGVGT